MDKNQKIMYLTFGIFLFLFLGTFLLRVSFNQKKQETENTKTMNATVISVKSGKVTVQDKENVIYTFKTNDMKFEVDSLLAISYTGLLDKTKEVQESKIIRYSNLPVSYDEDGVSVSYLDDGIFKDYYILANEKLKKMSLQEKIGQLLLVRYPDSNQEEALKKYQFGGYVFFEKDFDNLSEKEVKSRMEHLQEIAKIPILTAVDEEGGDVVRVSSHPQLVKEKFPSPKELYQKGGMDEIQKDTLEKSAVLKNLGLNLNLAPVVDVSTSPSDYMYARALGEDTALTATYAKTVIESSQGTGVSYTLKHFPGYGNNQDTHTTEVEDTRSKEDIRKNDLPPFQAGIDQGAEAVLVSHNKVVNFDRENIASLSPTIHNLLRNELHFTGIIMTDDLSMKATSSVSNRYVKALLAGNDLLLVTDYEDAFQSIQKAVEEGSLGEALLDKLALRVIAWKYYKGLLFEIVK